MTGGDVAMSTAAELVIIPGRVSITGTKVAPASGSGKWTVSLTSHIFSIVFTEAYAEFLGAQITVENATIGATTSGSAQYGWTASTKTLAVQFADLDGTPTQVDLAFSFIANFTESKAP